MMDIETDMDAAGGNEMHVDTGTILFIVSFVQDPRRYTRKAEVSRLAASIAFPRG
jgi:hypothetical protein